MEPEIVGTFLSDLREQLSGLLGLAEDLIALIDRLVVLAADAIRSLLSALAGIIGA